MRAPCYLPPSAFPSAPLRPFTTTTLRSRLENLYTITTPPDIPRTLSAVRHSCKNLPHYLAQRPIPPHAPHSFSTFLHWLSTRPANRRLILDSGCGTGRSTLAMARLMPSCDVVGVDKSLVRLQRTEVYRRYRGIPPALDNAFLVRADLVDFWRLCLHHRIYPTHHFLLYPNPFPKQKSLKVRPPTPPWHAWLMPVLTKLTSDDFCFTVAASFLPFFTRRATKLRWHGHPVFPILVALGGRVEVRSSWVGYLHEFRAALHYAHHSSTVQSLRAGVGSRLVMSEVHQLTGVSDMADAVHRRPWSNFEGKYVRTGQPIYRVWFDMRVEEERKRCEAVSVR